MDDKAYRQAVEHAEKVKKYEIYYHDVPTTVHHMYNITKELYARLNKPLIIFIDHSRLVKKEGTGEQEMMNDLVSMCIALKKEIKCSIFILSQLNREIEKADRINNPQGHYPMRSDIFMADSLYQGADMVAILHRPELLNGNVEVKFR